MLMNTLNDKLAMLQSENLQLQSVRQSLQTQLENVASKLESTTRELSKVSNDRDTIKNRYERLLSLSGPTMIEILENVVKTQGLMSKARVAVGDGSSEQLTQTVSTSPATVASDDKSAQSSSVSSSPFATDFGGGSDALLSSSAAGAEAKQSEVGELKKSETSAAESGVAKESAWSMFSKADTTEKSVDVDKEGNKSEELVVDDERDDESKANQDTGEEENETKSSNAENDEKVGSAALVGGGGASSNVPQQQDVAGVGLAKSPEPENLHGVSGVSGAGGQNVSDLKKSELSPDMFAGVYVDPSEVPKKLDKHGNPVDNVQLLQFPTGAKPKRNRRASAKSKHTEEQEDDEEPNDDDDAESVQSAMKSPEPFAADDTTTPNIKPTYEAASSDMRNKLSKILKRRGGKKATKSGSPKADLKEFI